MRRVSQTSKNGSSRKDALSKKKRKIQRFRIALDVSIACFRTIGCRRSCLCCPWTGSLLFLVHAPRSTGRREVAETASLTFFSLRSIMITTTLLRRDIFLGISTDPLERRSSYHTPPEEKKTKKKKATNDTSTHSSHDIYKKEREREFYKKKQSATNAKL